jgi:hypothetical protein
MAGLCALTNDSAVKLHLNKQNFSPTTCVPYRRNHNPEIKSIKAPEKKQTKRYISSILQIKTKHSVD